MRRLGFLLMLTLLAGSARCVAGEQIAECKPLGDPVASFDLPVGVEDSALRRAIIDQRPLQEIVNLAADSDLSARPQAELLTVATRYPVALEWLLSRGANPNVIDDTGHTPLMYAVRFDRLESVDLLLEKGADVNALTVASPDCFYSVALDSPTALHHAARYASANVIRRLLDAGAFTFQAAKNGGDSPRDWLRRFGNDDRAAPLDKTDRAYVDLALKPADDATRVQLSTALAERGTRLYRQQEFEAAYVAMRDALRAWPYAARNSRWSEALADFSLIALRAGHALDSANASRQVIEGAREPKLRAAAWFNTGLACEMEARQAHDRLPVYCSSYAILEFLNAWREFPTKDRETKILEVLGEMPSHCTYDVYHGRTEDYFLIQANDRSPTLNESPQRVLVRHAPGAPPPVDSVEYSLARISGAAPATRHTVFIEQYDFTNTSVSVLRGLGEIQGTVRVRGQECRFD